MESGIARKARLRVPHQDSDSAYNEMAAKDWRANLPTWEAKRRFGFPREENNPLY